MRLLLIFPLAFISGVDGLIIFLPYLIAVMLIWHIGKSTMLSASIEELRPIRVDASPMPAIDAALV